MTKHLYANGTEQHASTCISLSAHLILKFRDFLWVGEFREQRLRTDRRL